MQQLSAQSVDNDTTNSKETLEHPFTDTKETPAFTSLFLRFPTCPSILLS